MNWSTKFSLVGAIAGGIALVMGVAHMALPTGIAARQGEFVACMSFGCTYCGEMTVSACGVSLNKCTDTRTYHCMHDIAIKIIP